MLHRVTELRAWSLTALCALVLAAGWPTAAQASEQCSIVGTDGPDELVGTEAADVICGRGGDDVIYGLGGDDIILGDTGSDLLVGGDGNDRLVGGNEHDRLLGGDGNDTLEGETGFDTLLGEEGDDLLNGGNDADVLLGGAGADTIDGALGIDTLHGGDGDDILLGGNDQDNLFGGNGNDTVNGDLGNDMLFGGQGDDALNGGHDQDSCDGGTGSNSFALCETTTSDPGPDIEESGDADSDGLADEAEAAAGTNPLQADSDWDGLDDAEEILTLTDPSRYDSDWDGIGDRDEDTDQDGVSNASELGLGLIPFKPDSDGDGLVDADELNAGLSALLADSDADGIDDGQESLLGVNPTLFDTDGDGVSDGDEVYTLTLQEPTTSASVTVTGSASAVLDSRISATPIEWLEGVPGLASAAVTVTAPGVLEGTLHLTFDPQAIAPGHDVAVLHFDEESATFDRPESQVVDLAAGTATVTTNDFSPFVVVDITAFEQVWASEITTPRTGGGTVTAIDAALVLDESGSMSSNDPQGLRKTAAKSFVDALLPGDRAAVGGFTTSYRVRQHLTEDMVAVKSAIDRITASGGTSITAAMSGGLNELDTYGLAENQRVLVLLTDGQGSYSSALTQRAIDSDTTVYTVGLGASVDANLLRSIATATGGEYFQVANASGLADAFDRVGQDLGAPDSDGDGLADAAETSGWRDGAGRVYVTNPLEADTDGDGLSDGEEAGALVSSGNFGARSYYKTPSSPTLSDTDRDGLSDSQELDLETHRRLADSDGDSLSDLTEVGAGFNPTNFNEDGDYKFDDEEFADGSDPYGYDLEGWDNAHAAVSGFWFGDAWNTTLAQWAQVNINVASSPWYLVGQAGSGFVVIGDLRDLVYGLGATHWGDAAWAAVGIIPFAGDAAKVVRSAVKFASKSARAVRAAVEFASKMLPKRYADDVAKTVGKLANARLPQDIAASLFNPPAKNWDILTGTWSKGRPVRISGDAVQNAQLQDLLADLTRRNRDNPNETITDVRVNQRQVNAGGNVVGLNRPDLQYTLNGKRYYVEWDKPLCSDRTRSRRGNNHGERIYANDPSIDFTVQVILIIAGTCE